MEMIQMKIVCPYCGSDKFDTYEVEGGYGNEVLELEVCYNCNETFRVIYTFNRIEKDD